MISKILQVPIWLYRKAISPFMARNCRFHPTCSSYALEALKKHGAFKGLLLAAWRVMRCNPWHRCHYDDPVPETFNITAHIRALISGKRSAINGRTHNQESE